MAKKIIPSTGQRALGRKGVIIPPKDHARVKRFLDEQGVPDVDPHGILDNDNNTITMPVRDYGFILRLASFAWRYFFTKEINILGKPKRQYPPIVKKRWWQSYNGYQRELQKRTLAPQPQPISQTQSHPNEKEPVGTPPEIVTVNPNKPSFMDILGLLPLFIEVSKPPKNPIFLVLWAVIRFGSFLVPVMWYLYEYGSEVKAADFLIAFILSLVVNFVFSGVKVYFKTK